MSPYLKINFLFINVDVSIYLYVHFALSFEKPTSKYHSLAQFQIRLANGNVILNLPSACMWPYKPTLKFVEKYSYFNEIDNRYIDCSIAAYLYLFVSFPEKPCIN